MLHSFSEVIVVSEYCILILWLFRHQDNVGRSMGFAVFTCKFVGIWHLTNKDKHTQDVHLQTKALKILSLIIGKGPENYWVLDFLTPPWSLYFEFSYILQACLGFQAIDWFYELGMVFSVQLNFMSLVQFFRYSLILLAQLYFTSLGTFFKHTLILCFAYGFTRKAQTERKVLQWASI